MRSLKIVTLLIAIFLIAAQLVAVYRELPGALAGESDFQKFYTARKIVRGGHGRDLQDLSAIQQLSTAAKSQSAAPRVFDRPGYEALVFVPFSLFNFRVAYFLFMAINLALLGFGVRLARPYLEKLPDVWIWLPGALFFCFLPVALALVHGSDAILLLTLILISAVYFYRDQDSLSGIFLGLALFGGQITLSIALLFVLWRKWRIVASFLLTIVGSGSISILLTGVLGFRAFLGRSLSWLPQTDGFPNLRCFIGLSTYAHFSDHFVQIATIILSAGLLIWGGTRPPSYALAILIALLVSYTGEIENLVLLIIPVGLVLDARITPVLRTQRFSRDIAALLFAGPSILFFAGQSYCVLAILMLPLLVTLRSTRAAAKDA